MFPILPSHNISVGRSADTSVICSHSLVTHPHRRSTIVVKASSKHNGDNREEVLKRIRKAKEYRKENEDRKHLDEQMESFAQASAAEEEGVFTAALAERQKAGRSAEDASTSSADAEGQQRPKSVRAANDGSSLRLAALRRIEAARKYAASNTSSSSPKANESTNAPAGEQQQAPPDNAPVEWGRSAAGNEKEAAPFLRQVMQQDTSSSASSELSAEQFTIAKEREQRARGAEIITVDQDYHEKLGGSEKDGAYRPKVATWGVFPRPANISREYGGGRTLRPGEALEPEAETAARKKRVQEALSQYKKKAGLEVDPVAEASAQAAYDRGVELMQRGQLAGAIVPFDEAIAFVSSRSRVGGEATLQKAICLDSMGRNDEAMALYRQISRHSAPGVAKKAKQMLFGFTSMDYLKTHTISYGVQRGAYDEYFTKLTGQWNNMYSADGEVNDGSLTVATVVATAVMMAPLVLVGVKVGAKLLK